VVKYAQGMDHVVKQVIEHGHWLNRQKNHNFIGTKKRKLFAFSKHYSLLLLIFFVEFRWSRYWKINLISNCSSNLILNYQEVRMHLLSSVSFSVLLRISYLKTSFCFYSKNSFFFFLFGKG